jgi:hypothetical protein
MKDKAVLFPVNKWLLPSFLNWSTKCLETTHQVEIRWIEIADMQY